MLIGAFLICIAGILQGLSQGYDITRGALFEQKFKVSMTSFFGSCSWERKSIKYKTLTKIFGTFNASSLLSNTALIFYILGGMLSAGKLLFVLFFTIFAATLRRMVVEWSRANVTININNNKKCRQ